MRFPAAATIVQPYRKFTAEVACFDENTSWIILGRSAQLPPLELATYRGPL